MSDHDHRVFGAATPDATEQVLPCTCDWMDTGHPSMAPDCPSHGRVDSRRALLAAANRIEALESRLESAETALRECAGNVYAFTMPECARAHFKNYPAQRKKPKHGGKVRDG
jgi:hypothetical protein